jgi:heterodisulfide reductase subunit A
VRNHPNITLWTLSEVTKVEGYMGNYKVTVKRWPRYILEDACIGCQECIDACVFKEGKTEDAFNEGLAKRTAYLYSLPQAVPQTVVIDPAACIQLKTGRCKEDLRGSLRRSVRPFASDMQETDQVVDVGSIIIATGYKTFDAARMPDLGYGIYPNVYTALEIERLVNASGPTAGEVVLRDGSKPQSVGIIHCVGSRDARTNPHCSRVCCMYSLKLAHLIKEHTGAEVFNFYIDMRTPGKGFEEFYQKLLHEGVHMIRGKVAEVTDWALDPTEEGKLILRVEDTLAGFVRRIPVDMVVLSTGLEPQEDANEVRRLFNISCSPGGFFLERHPKLAPVSTFSDGVFWPAVARPQGHSDTVAQAGARLRKPWP